MIDLDKIAKDAIKERNSILAELEPLKVEKAKLMEQFQSIDKKLRDIQQKIADIEKERGLADISRTIIRLGKPASGVKTLKAETGYFEKK